MSRFRWTSWALSLCANDTWRNLLQPVVVALLLAVASSPVFGLLGRRARGLVFVVALPWFVSSLPLPLSCASTVEIEVSGRIAVDDPLTLLPSSIRHGESWNGRIRYDTNVPDEDADPTHGRYFDLSRPDAISMSVKVGEHVFAGGGGQLQADVVNDFVPIPGQALQFPVGDSFAIGGPMWRSPRLLDHSSIFFSWHDPSGAALASDRLPANLDPFDFRQSDVAGTGLPTFSPIYITIQDIGLSTPTSTIYYTLVASIESAQVSLVPEPRTIMLLVFALTSWHSFTARLFRR